MKTGTEKKAVIRIISINLMLVLLLFGLVSLNKTVFRSAFSDSHFFQLLTGSFPNFIAGLLLCLCVVNPVLVKKPGYGRMMVYTGSLLIMAILILDELKSLVASEHYDIYDIIGSILGGALAIMMFEYLFYRKNH